MHIHIHVIYVPAAMRRLYKVQCKYFCTLCPCHFSTNKQAVTDIWVNSYRCILIRFYWEKQSLLLGSQDDELTSTVLNAYAGFIENSLLTILIFFHLSSEDIHTLLTAQHSSSELCVVKSLPGVFDSHLTILLYSLALIEEGKEHGKGKGLPWEDMSCHLGNEAIFTQHSS